MKKLLLLSLILLTTNVILGQEIERLGIRGRIIVETDDIEGVTIFNTSSNKGTITDSKGEFEIAVALNDLIDISALQFEKFTVKIDDKILKNQYMTIFLVEKVNKLDEVVIMPYDMLTGNLVTDVKSVETFNPDLDAIYFGVNDVYAFEFTDDYKTAVDNELVRQGEYYNGLNVMGVLSMVLKPIFKKDNTRNQTSDYPTVSAEVKDLTDVYGREFLSHTFNIPEDQVEAFVAFIEDDAFDYSLLDSGHEVELLEYLYGKSHQFLKGDLNRD